MRSQATYLLALKHGLSVDPKRMATELARLTERYRREGCMLKTGFLGTPILCEQLAAMGRPNLAYELLLNEDYPGWLYEVKQGAIAICRSRSPCPLAARQSSCCRWPDRKCLKTAKILCLLRWRMASAT